MTPIYVHPDNLSRGSFYRVIFKGCTTTEEFTIDARFEKMLIARDDDGHKRKVLSVVFRVAKEQYARVISWYRITHLEQLSESEALKE